MTKEADFIMAKESLGVDDMDDLKMKKKVIELIEGCIGLKYVTKDTRLMEEIKMIRKLYLDGDK